MQRYFVTPFIVFEIQEMTITLLHTLKRDKMVTVSG